MSHDAASHGQSAGDLPFSAAEIAELHAADRAAGRNIVVLMLTIFVLGLILYTVIDYSVAG